MTKYSVYFGVPPTKGQIVSDEVKARGLELLRIDPAGMNVVATPTILQPGYSNYRAHLPQFMHQTMLSSTTSCGAFAPLVHGNLPILPIPMPSVVATFAEPLLKEQLEYLTTNQGWATTVVRGRSGIIHKKPTPAILQTLEATYKPILTSPAPENAVNISAFKQCLLVMRILSTFLRINQYPAFKCSSHLKDYESVTPISSEYTCISLISTVVASI
jgi:hypothetical protein